jgi:formamidopyrimidine-DNA glycosylase
MPELPEVETIAQRLRGGDGQPSIIGSSISGISTEWPRHFEDPPYEIFRERILGQPFLDVGRRGKFLVLPNPQATMLIHLRMSGDLHLESSGAPPGRFERTIFQLDNGHELRFRDARKFGRIYLLEEPEKVLGKLGPEPLASDFSTEQLQDMLAGKKRQIKPLLLDQSFIAGIGNIYVDESLHRARIHPRTLSHTLTGSQVTGLHEAIRESLTLGIQNNGATIDWVYQGGEYQNQFRVVQRAGEPCPVCCEAIERIVVGQRGTYICPVCQPEVSI